MADNGRLDGIDKRLEIIESAYLEDRERWNQNQRENLQMMGLLAGLGKELGDHGRLLDRITERLDRITERLDRHDAMLDRIDGSLDATLKALHRLLEGR